MAAKNRQPQLHRGLSLLLSLSVISGSVASAGDIEPSRYAPFGGDKFFLLSESTFHSGEEARVRLEVPGSRDALEPYSGVDVRVYRVPRPIEFLRKQKNLHRPILRPNFSGEGLTNAVNYLWDSWYKKSRLVWQRLFAYPARREAVKKNPGLRQTPAHTYQTRFQNTPQFRPIAGLEVADEFRYPVWQARPVARPEGVKLLGSSSDFLQPRVGDLYIPLGKRKPGLYLVEAAIGSFRANAFVFVSDTAAVTKISGRQLLVWTVDKRSGLPAARTSLLLTDGVGTLAGGVTDKNGVFILNDKSQERSYVLGSDAAGGVFISENFYFDSEIYATKLYAFTDRPLYQPGDTVFFKLLGREFQASTRSTGLAPAVAQASPIDPTGTPLLIQKVDIAPGIDGGQGSFRLPEEAGAGGYALKIIYRQAAYNSSFRVARYVKPHFELDITLGKKEYKANEPVRGRIKANYPDGSPLKNAKIGIEVRKQKLTMVEGEIQYLDRFPVRILNKDYTADGSGAVDFELPAAAEPSRYLLTARAVDGSSFRVTAAREFLIEAQTGALWLTARSNFSAPNETTVFHLESPGGGPAKPEVHSGRWEAVRLEDQTKLGGDLAEGQTDFKVTFPRPGSYSVSASDREGRLLGSLSHWVQGPELAGMPGTISILLDKDRYEPGETATALLTFSEDVSEALISLERDKVEKQTLLSNGAPWFKAAKISSREWRAKIPVQEAFSPNITLSVAYVREGRYVFENKGIRVAVPKIDIRFHADKEKYAPGDKVTVDVQTSLKGKPVRSNLAVSVVDEMIYALQPEIAPDISDFFYHPRRNQVRTASSLSFHSFDAAVSLAGAAPSAASAQPERGLKLRERPRRENKDTAYWAPTLKTDASGRARFSFVMPDSLTRWRMTGRAMSAAGLVGQRTDYLLSAKDFYLKWSGPAAFREGDAPKVGVIAFNLGTQDRQVSFEAEGMGSKIKETVTLKPGANHLAVPIAARASGSVGLRLTSEQGTLDELATAVAVAPKGWRATRSIAVEGASAKLPAGAFNIRLSLGSGPGAGFLRAVDSLADYPYGCVEQTASRLLPLSLAYRLVQSQGLSALVRRRLQERIVHERLRLVKMAGPEAAFAWWGDQTARSAFMTAYAYFADWAATSALNIALPPSHWERVLDVYKKSSDREPAFQKAIIVWLASEMGLPTRTLLQGVLETLPAMKPGRRAAKSRQEGESEILASSAEPLQQGMTLVLLELVAKKNEETLPAPLAQRLPGARKLLAESESPLARSLLLLEKSAGGGLSADERKSAEAVSDALNAQGATIDRSLSLLFLYKAVGADALAAPVEPGADFGPDWIKAETGLGRPLWRYRAAAGRKVKLPAAVSGARPGSSQLIYDFYGREGTRLPLKITRRLYRLEQQEKALEFKAAPMGEDWRVDSSGIYVDELELTPQPGSAFQFGLVEAALPPGAEVEETTWGMKIQDAKGESMQIGEPSFQSGDLSYSAAIERLDKPMKIHHLVRFSQSGDFAVPPARFFRMYAPAEKAFEGGHESAFRKIIVR